MIDFDVAVRMILSRARPLPAVKVSLADADGLFIARAVSARFASPRFDQSAMDGYAVRVADVAAATAAAPVPLPVDDVLPTGTGRRPKLRPATAIRVFTGAPLPHGTEAVVMQEYCREQGGAVHVTQPVRRGENVRCRGEEYDRGALMLAPGVRITPPVIGLIAALGRAQVWVRGLPRVTVISIGDELVPAGQKLRPGLIHDSNSPALASALARSGISGCRTVRVPDAEPAIRRAVAAALRRSDVVITVAGVSVGDYDFVTAVADQLGIRREFWKIAMKPGKPVLFGTWRGRADAGERGRATLFFGLPGNPVSALVTYQLLVEPALSTMMGAAQIVPSLVGAALTVSWRKRRGRRHFLRGRLDLSGKRPVVTPLAAQGSHMLGGLAHANCLIDLPAEATAFRAGQMVAVRLLNWNEF